MIFMLNFNELLHTIYKYVLNSVVKISMMLAKYFEYYTIILGGGRFFVDTLYNYIDDVTARANPCGTATMWVV